MSSISFSINGENIQHVKRNITCNQGKRWMYLGFQEGFKKQFDGKYICFSFPEGCGLFGFLILQGYLYYPHHSALSLGYTVTKQLLPADWSAFHSAREATLTSVSASTALSSNSVMVFLTPSCTRIPKLCTMGSESSTGRRVIWKVWVTYNDRKVQVGHLSPEPTGVEGGCPLLS